MSKPTPLLLLPGLMNDERVWQSVQDGLPSGREIKVGLTHEADTVSAMAAKAIETLPPGRFAVAGFSLGGYVALEVARQAFDRIAGIALLGAGARSDPDDVKATRQQMVEALAAGQSSFARIASGFAPRLLHPVHAQDEAIVELLTDMARKVGAAGFARQQAAAMNRPDSRALLRAIGCPALVICGAQDQVCPAALSVEAARLFAGSVDFVELAECGHMSTLEQPDAVVAAFRRWLGLVDSQAAAS